MSSTIIKLSRDEVFQAIAYFVEKKYPVSVEKASVNLSSTEGVQGATITCTLKK